MKKILKSSNDGKGTVVGIVIMVADAGNNILAGKRTWRDGVTLVIAGAVTASMATGFGELIFGGVSIGWDIVQAVHKFK
jgi:hypothetical protein